MKLASLYKKEFFYFHPCVFCLTCLAITTLFFFHYKRGFNYTTPNIQQFNQNNQGCDLFKGKWVPDQTGPLYTNYNCATIPIGRNCLNDRKDTDFLHWRWKPHKCKLRRFDPYRFFTAVKGKKMAFIGDSLARNQVNSLICLLSSVETPQKLENQKEPIPDNAKGASFSWEFPRHNFTVLALWSPFLVDANEIIVNNITTGHYHLQLDKVDTIWSKNLPSIDYAIFSDVQWFLRKNYVYEGGGLIGCVHCNEPNMTDLGLGFAMKKVIRTAFKAINDCKSCGKIFTMLRTYSPAHYEDGGWNSGGTCNKTRPIIKKGDTVNASDLGIRNVQVEEIETARNAGNKFEVIDITEMMLMRPDGHPGVHHGAAWLKGISDCVHWCLPGPIDTWNELLLELITRRSI